ncbi:hypothetical protein GGF46_003202 [Coemansia sp. RSA 552]|nr:hypothetical protein GGF46_003202 [Coemansia sp. RSA 552]
MSTRQKLLEIKEKVDVYEKTPFSRALPLAQHQLWQLVPIIGNIVVFFQTCTVVRRINKTVHIPLHERAETWASVYVLLVVGMIPILGLILTIYCTHGSDHLRIATHNYMHQNEKHQNPADMEEGTKKEDIPGVVVAESAAPLVESRPDSARSASSTRSKRSLKDVLKRQGSIMSSKSQAVVAQDQKEKQPEAKLMRKHSVFDRVSKMPWMEEVMAQSPTDNYRMSLSTTSNNSTSLRKPHYADIHDLATRNSKLHAPSLEDLPLYSLSARETYYASDDLQLLYSSKRLTRSLLIDDTVLDSRESLSNSMKLLKRPDYSHLGTPSELQRKSSSLIGLAPSPQFHIL